MTDLPAAQSLQEEFLLTEFANKVVPPQNSSANHRFCCWYRFHPQYQNISNANLQKIINEVLNDSFTSNINKYLSSLIQDKIIPTFGDKMKADGVELESLSRPKGRPKNLGPWTTIYEWLWEKEFPRQGWKFAQEMATYAIEELQMIDPKDLDRDICLKVAKNPAMIHKEKEYALRVYFPHPGHLLLINQGVSGKRYCLCPSLAFSLETHVMPEKKLHIPGIKALASALKYMEIGNEYFLAILTENPVNLSWVHPESEPADILVTDERLQEIFKQVGRQWNAQVFYKKFEVVE